MVVLDEPIKGVLDVRNYIDGEWVESGSEEYREAVNPATMRPLARVPMGCTEDVEAAVDAAQEAFPAWRRTTPLTRARYFFRLKDLLEQHFEEVSRVCTMEHGKTIDESRGEVRRGIENVEVATGIPSLMMGYNLEDISTGIDEAAIKQPLGVFACIAPFNFPFMVPLWFMPIAVATGNTYIIKPSPWTPLSMVKLMELVDEAGFPPGVINMVHGDVEPVQAILEHPGVKGVSFVGSSKIGRDVIYREAASHGKRVQAQCSAKNFLVIMPDADVESTVPGLLSSFFGNAGQRCLAGANLVMVGDDEKFIDGFLGKVQRATQGIRIGYGLEEGVQMGPLQAVPRKQRVMDYIEKGVDEGASLMLDGRKYDCGGYPRDCFLGPSIFQGVQPNMTIAKEEIFGPVMSVLHAGDLGDAIGMVNASNYGNAASIFTGSGKAARRFQYEVECGNVGVNIGTVAPMAFFPFSGMKDSFYGDLHGQGRDAVDFFTERKVVIQRWP
ncbi:methylmalonate-semialdehyde dehydrogenase (acylating) [Candidatus Bathyarchaeota archaeon RBG_13_60_20]|jgi:malonate-semialdehyde dehydrogenase (acetylating)/methylmalonate-semialdehyde dehydrogenase|nr:MAG: methylmalonate-semialdehyde dehydrogenase (acylating) [Candidatus Bathyarchaeota archaeon RBG_13_60_20]